MRAYDPAAGEAAARLDARARRAARPLRSVAPAPTSSRCSRSGKSCGGSTSSGCARRCDARRSSTRGTCSIRLRCAGAGSSTAASAADEPDRRYRRRGIRRLAPLRGVAAARRSRSSRSTTSPRAGATTSSTSLDVPGFELVVADVSEELPVAGAVDGVLHLACPASPPEYLEMPLETLDVCSIGTRRALDLARDQRCAVPAGVDQRGLRRSARTPAGGELSAATSTRSGPRAVYDEAKRFAETLTMTYHRLYDLPTRIVRIFNTYGPRLRPADGRVVSNFLAQAIDGKPLTVYGSGTQTRSFCYVDDEVRGILALFDSDVVEPVNIGNPVEFTMLELAALVCEVTGSTAELVFEPLPGRRPRPAPTRHHTRARAAAAGSRRSSCEKASNACTPGTWRSALVDERDIAAAEDTQALGHRARLQRAQHRGRGGAAHARRRASRRHRARDHRRRRRQHRRHA